MSELLLTRAKAFIGAAPSMHGEGEAHTIIRQLVEEVGRLEMANEEFEHLFKLHYDAGLRAIKCWQAQNPGNERVWPDAAKLQVWLMDEIEGKNG